MILNTKSPAYLVNCILYVFILTACYLPKSKAKDNVFQIAPDPYCKNDSLLINNELFIVTRESDARLRCLTNIDGDTIIPFADYYSDIELLDINQDGAMDIRVYEFSQTPNQCQNYLYDKKQNVFRLVENCMLDIKKIAHTDFFYSYNAVSCSDMNWESDLGKIENNRFVIYGHMYGNGCDGDEKKEIEIYKISGHNKELYKRLPYAKFIPDYNDKWKFMEQYWAINYRYF